ncbi:MAG: transposase [Rhizobiaceae bacterium]|nr:MAG: transposase [Rhizobiaceae bacterium]
MTMPRVEVITSVERRRRWSRDEKERLVAASFEPGVSVSEIARSAGIHVSQLFRWRKDLCERVDAAPSQLVPVEIVPAAAMPCLRPILGLYAAGLCSLSGAHERKGRTRGRLRQEERDRRTPVRP